MKLFYEKVKEKGLGFFRTSGTEKEFTNINTVFSNAVVFNVQNVNDYLENGGDDGNLWSPDMHPILAPPYNAMWFEYRSDAAPEIFGISSGERKIHFTNELGILVEAIDLEEIRENYPQISNHEEIPAFIYDEEERQSVEIAFMEGTETTKWMLILWLVINKDGDGIVPGFALTVFVHEDGTFDRDGRYTSRLILPDKLKEEMDESQEKAKEILGDSLQIVMAITKPVLMAISFMHCKNVEEVVYDPDEVKKKRKRGRVRRRKPQTIYRTLRIGKTTKLSDSTGGTGAKRAMHIARGHFKTFTSAAPLLGKHTGTYWWSPQVRGNPIHGNVKKDYEVNVPDDLG